jgi:hypothetical protein
MAQTHVTKVVGKHRDFDPKISYWTELKEKYMKENPDIITLDNYKEKK